MSRLLAAWAALSAALLVGCAPGGEATGSRSARSAPGGTVVVGMFSDFDGLNELTSTDANATAVMENMLYVPLLRWGPDLKIEGRLATSWQRSDDGREIIMDLRQDVRWHDGAPTTADDVVFSFERFKDPALGYPDVGGLRQLDSVEALGPYRVRFRFARAYADQLANLRKVIVPKHLLQDIASERMESADFNRNPVGNGPFRFVRWRQNQEIVFEANPDFPDGPPRTDRIVFRVIPDQTVLETAFLSGEIDVVERLRFDAVGRLREDPRCRVHTYRARGFQYVGWNLREPLFEDASVRRAMTMAMDRGRIVDALVFGEGRVTAHPVMSLSPYYAADLPPHPHDPEQAARLLDAAGWIDRDGDGVREKDGLPFEFVLLTNLGNRQREDALVMIQDDLAKVGVRVVPRMREWSVLLDDVQAKRFQAVLGGWQTDFVLSPYDTFHSEAIEGKYNTGSYSNLRVDELIVAGLAAPTAQEAAPIWHEFQEILHREQPYSVMFELDYSVGASPALEGVEVDVRGWLISIERWARTGRGTA